MIAQRTLRSAQSALRSATRPSAVSAVPRVAARRGYTKDSIPEKVQQTVGSVTDKVQDNASSVADKVQEKVHEKAGGSDTPWAVASVIVFGGLFVYLTAPGQKKNDHGHGHGKEKHSEETHDEPEEEKEPVELPNGNIEHPEGFVEVKRPEIREDAPEGDKHLHSQKVSDEHAFEKQSQVKRETSLPHDNTTFQHGLAAAKDGNPISDPKKVVAAAKTAKEEKQQAKQQQKEAEE